MTNRIKSHNRHRLLNEPNEWRKINRKIDSTFFVQTQMNNYNSLTQWHIFGEYHLFWQKKTNKILNDSENETEVFVSWKFMTIRKINKNGYSIGDDGRQIKPIKCSFFIASRNTRRNALTLTIVQYVISMNWIGEHLGKCIHISESWNCFQSCILRLKLYWELFFINNWMNGRHSIQHSTIHHFKIDWKKKKKNERNRSFILPKCCESLCINWNYNKQFHTKSNSTHEMNWIDPISLFSTAPMWDCVRHTAASVCAQFTFYFIWRCVLPSHCSCCFEGVFWLVMLGQKATLEKLNLSQTLDTIYWKRKLSHFSGFIDEWNASHRMPNGEAINGPTDDTFFV